MKQWIRKQKGLTQVEFSLIALAVMLVLFMIIEFAIYFLFSANGQRNYQASGTTCHGLFYF